MNIQFIVQTVLTAAIVLTPIFYDIEVNRSEE